MFLCLLTYLQFPLLIFKTQTSAIFLQPEEIPLVLFNMHIYCKLFISIFISLLFLKNIFTG